MDPLLEIWGCATMLNLPQKELQFLSNQAFQHLRGMQILSRKIIPNPRQYKYSFPFSSKLFTEELIYIQTTKCCLHVEFSLTLFVM